MEVNKTAHVGINGSEPRIENQKVVAEQRKEIEAIWSEEQKQRLQRSLLGVCVRPIELREVMDRLLEEWEGPREIECRDVGSYRCLITFSSPEIRDEVLQSSLLQRYFDEIRPHWEIFWSLSRRIWLEIMGCQLLCGVKRISVKLLEPGARCFEMFVKEFGSEVYSVQSHPDLEEVIENSVSEEGLSTRLLVRETSPKVEKAPTRRTETNLNEMYVGDPQLDAIIPCVLRPVQKSNPYNGSGGAEVEETREGIQNIVILSAKGCTVDERVVWMDMDPMIHEYRIVKKN
ncbi:hypothetical protein PIB30_037902 [Stylosanthes scabra]|uniref:Uncharacterized protein n=1 Tax=Stylosanthes scabra TaxID=79078 RepID=A0ABU6QDY2_9FABA|nr:hypothetical protein [Stylosanthes scabra]